MMNSWNDMQTYLEEVVLADCLKGRVRWNCISLPGIDNAVSFEVYVDDVLAKRFSMEMVARAAYGERKPGEKWDMKLFWEGYWAQKALPLNERSEFDDEDFSMALMEYRCLDAHESIVSDDPVVRMFAVLDRSICRDILTGLACQMDEQPEWLRLFYRLRMQAEKI